MDIEKANSFLDRTIAEFKLDSMRCSIHTNGTTNIKELSDSMFGFAFFYDCIIKGYKVQKKLIKENIGTLSKTANPDKITKQFDKFKNQNHLILIAAYEQLVFYLYNIIKEFLAKNTNYLYSKGELGFSAKDIVTYLEDGTLLDKIISLRICKNKTFSLVTDYNHWVRLLKDIKIPLYDDEIAFFELLHFRRNVASHLSVQKEWVKLKDDIKYNNLILWLYGILNICLRIDSIIILHVTDLKTSPIAINLFERGMFIFEKE